MRALPLAFVVLLGLAWPSEASAQRFGGQFGGAGGLWLLYVAPDIGAEQGFGRDPGDIILLGGRGFVQLGRVRLGGGGFGGGFTDEGLNSADNQVTGSFGGGGFTAEYLAVQQTWELGVGGMVGGGTLTLEERLSVVGDVEMLNRREESFFIGMPWARLGYNAAPFVNVGLQVGFLAGSGDLDGPTLGLDIVLGLIP